MRPMALYRKAINDLVNFGFKKEQIFGNSGLENRIMQVKNFQY